MNYWLAETTDLTETLRPLWDLMYRSRDRGSEVATKMYGCPGYVSHHNLDLWGDSAPHGSGTAYSIWPSSHLWLSQHMMEHYRFTGDKTFLREKAWPLFKDIAAFCDCYIFEFDGKWTSGPSISPENVFIIPKDGSKAGSKESFDIPSLWTTLYCTNSSPTSSRQWASLAWTLAQITSFQKRKTTAMVYDLRKSALEVRFQNGVKTIQKPNLDTATIHTS